MNLKPFIASTAAAAVLAGGALVSATAGLLSPARDEAVRLVPASAVVYGNVFLDPSIPQKLALQDLIARFPGASTPEQAKAAITRFLDEGLEEIGMSFAEDVEPWLGRQVAFFALPPPSGLTPSGAPTDVGAAVLIASDDGAATQAALDKAIAVDESRSSSAPTTPATHNGVDYLVSIDGQDAVAVIDDFLVLGNESGLKAVADARAGASLGSSDDYQEAVGGLTEDRLASFYLDPGKVLATQMPPGMATAFGDTGGVSVLYARSDALVVETSSSGPPAPGLMPTSGTDLIDTLPGDSWAAFGIPTFGGSLQVGLGKIMDAVPGAPPGAGLEMIDQQFQAQFGLSLQEDVLSWLGDVAVFARGDSVESIGGGVVIRASDPARAAAALPKIKAALQKGGVPIKPLDMGGFEGFSIQDKAMPEAINVALADERVLIVYGRDSTLAALGSDPSLAGSESFTAAKSSLGDGFAVIGFLDIGSIVGLFESAASSDPIYQNNVKPYLDRLSSVAIGSKKDGDHTVTRVVISVR